MGEWCAIWAGSKSDGKARREMHGFKRWWKTLQMCDGCLAENPAYATANMDRAYNDYRGEAGWRSTCIGHDEYMMDAEHVSPFAVCEGFRYELCLRDHAHLDNLGYGRDTGAALIKSFHKRGELGPGDLDFQLRMLVREMNQVPRGKGERRKTPGYLSKAACGLDNLYTFPELTASFKAKSVEAMNKFLCRKAINLARKPGADKVCRVRAMFAWGYLEQHVILDNADFFLTAAEVDSFCVAGRTFLVSLQRLQQIDKEKYIWKDRPKHHGLDHLMDHMRRGNRLNPKRISCLHEELRAGPFSNTLLQ